MPEVTEVQSKKTAGFVGRSGKHERRRAKIEQEEKELQELIQASSQEGQQEEQEEEQEEVQSKSQEKEEVKTEEKKEESKELSPEEKTFKKRYGDLRRHMAEKEKEWEKKLADMEKRMGNSDIVPPKSDEDIKEWQKKYPDVAGIVQTVAERIAEEKFKDADERLKRLDELNYETTRKTAEQKIREAHSDFDKLRDSDAFHDWAEKQPKWVQDALYENEDDPASVIRVIDLYKVDNDMTPKAKKVKEKEAASSVTARGKTSVDVKDTSNKIRESDVAKMSDKEYEENEQSILEAMRNGDFIYDISGAAR